MYCASRCYEGAIPRRRAVGQLEDSEDCRLQFCGTQTVSSIDRTQSRRHLCSGTVCQGERFWWAPEDESSSLYEENRVALPLEDAVLEISAQGCPDDIYRKRASYLCRHRPNLAVPYPADSFSISRKRCSSAGRLHSDGDPDRHRA